MLKRPILGPLLAAGALALLLSFKTPSDTGLTGPGSTGSSGNTTSYTGQVTGSAIQTPYGIVQVRLTLANGKITEVTVLQAPQGGRDTQLTNYSTPLLRSEVLQAQSAKVDTISGATYTSLGYLQSVQSALDRIGSGFTGDNVADATAVPTATPASPTNGAAATTSARAGSAAAYTGEVAGRAVVTRYGAVQVTVTLDAGRITEVVVLQAPQGGHDGELTAYATPLLRSEVLQAQSANVDTISGATFTSRGYLQSVQSALDQAGIKA
jgi:uncharacterized protein with FMN-binding domain